MERFLVKTTYRAILKNAVAVDKDAALRSVLVAFPCSFYDPLKQQWTSVDVRQEWLASRRAVDDYVRELNGLSDWYLPHRVEERLKRDLDATAAAVAASRHGTASTATATTAKGKQRKEGKKGKGSSSSSDAKITTDKSTSSPSLSHPSLTYLKEDAVAYVRRLYRTTPLTTQNLNNAFATVKMLSYVMQLQKELPSIEGTGARTTTSTTPITTSTHAKLSGGKKSGGAAAGASHTPTHVGGGGGYRMAYVLPDGRNLSGFELLRSGIAPINHPSLSGEGELSSSSSPPTSSSSPSTPSSKEESSALKAARKIAEDAAKLKQQQQGGKEGETATEAAEESPATNATAESAATCAADPSPSPAAPAAPAPPTPTPAAFGLQLLVAHPLMGGFFRHSIVMLSQAGRGGALGFIINKPVVNDEGQLMPVWSFIPDVVHPIFNRYLKNNAVFIGGPVASPASSNHALFIIHRVPNVPGSVPLGEGLYTTNDFTAVYHMFEEGRAAPEDVMVLLGYCGWGEGQLEHEERSGSWVALRRAWDHKDSRMTPRHTTTADYVFSKNVVVDPSTNLPLRSFGGSADSVSTTAAATADTSSSSSSSTSTRGGTKGSLLAKKEAGDATTTAPAVPSSSSSSSSSSPVLPSFSPASATPLDSPTCSAVGEPRRSWISLFGSLGPQYAAMARLADVRVDPHDAELYDGAEDDEDD